MSFAQDGKMLQFTIPTPRILLLQIMFSETYVGYCAVSRILCWNNTLLNDVMSINIE